MGTRGAYAKGVAKREEILATALDVIADQSVNGASVKELAAAVGLSQAGLLHYFDSKEDLFIQILAARDEDDARRMRLVRAWAEDAAVEEEFAGRPDAALATFIDVVRHNNEVPGLVELFSRMSVDAAAQGPAHDYFLARNTRLRQILIPVFAELQQQGRLDPHADPGKLARSVQAVSDGLQLQALVEPGLDLGAGVEAFLRLLVPDLDTTVPGGSDGLDAEGPDTVP